MKVCLKGERERYPNYLNSFKNQDFFLDDDSIVFDLKDDRLKISILSNDREVANKSFNLKKIDEKNLFRFLYNFINKYRETKKRQIEFENYKDKMEVFLNISNLIANISNLESLLSVLMEYSIKLVNAELGNIILFEEEEESVEWGFPITALKQIQIEEKKIIDYIKGKKETVIINSEKKKLNKKGIKSLISIPINFQSDIIGAINIINKKNGNEFNKRDVEMLKSVSMVAAVSIEREKTYEENLEKDRMMRELEVAHDVQRTLIPKSPPKIKNFEIYADTITALEIGGDFYDFKKKDESLIVAIGDVSSKGVSAGLMMSSTISYLNVYSEILKNTNEIVKKTNDILYKDIENNMFVTLFLCKLNFNEGKLYYTNAGHNYPVIVKKDGSINELKGGGPFVGQFNSFDYISKEVDLEKDDLIFLYTYGIIEGKIYEGSIYGKQRVYRSLIKNRDKDLETIHKSIMSGISKKCDMSNRWDDMTLICMRYNE